MNTSSDEQHQKVPAYALNWENVVHDDLIQQDYDLQHGDKTLEAQGQEIMDAAQHMPIGMPGTSMPVKIPVLRQPSPEPSGFCGCCTSSKPETRSTRQRNDSGWERNSIHSIGSSTMEYNLQKTDSFVNFAQLAQEAQIAAGLAMPKGYPTQAPPPDAMSKGVSTKSVLGNQYSATGRVIGWGAEGTIRVVKRKSDGTFCVAKVFKTSGKQEIHLIRAAWEFRVGSLIRGHPNVIQVLDLLAEDELAATIMEYAPGGNLRQSLIKGYVKNCRMADGIFVQMIRGVLWMHSQGVAHRDIKLENMLWHPRRPLLKLTDFGNCDIFWTRPILEASSTGSGYRNRRGSLMNNLFVEDREAILPDAQTWKLEVQQQVAQQRQMSEEFLRAVGMGRGQGAAAALPSLIQPKGNNPSIPLGKPTTPSIAKPVINPMDSIPHPESDDPASPKDFDFGNDLGDAYHPPPIPPMLRPPAPWNMPPSTEDRAFKPLDRDCPIRLSHGCVGTTAYIAPEQFASLGSNDPTNLDLWYDARLVDVWMLGIAYIYLTTQLVPWPAASETEYLFKRYKEKGTNKIIDTVFGVQEINGTRMSDAEGAKRVLNRMLTVDVKQRIMLSELDSDPWFQNRAQVYDKEVEERRWGSKGFYVDPADGPQRRDSGESSMDEGITF